MNTKKLAALKAQASDKLAQIDRSAVIELISAYEGIVRSEDFWGQRGPAMADELRAVRSAESPLRAMVAHGKLVAAAVADAEAALAAIDAHRAG